MGNNSDFWRIVDHIRRRDDRVKRQMYAFVMESLDFTIQSLGERRHVSARELLDGMCAYARQRFGLLAGEVLSSWGVASPREVGRVVFHLVDAGVLSRRAEDSPEDFHIDYDLKARLEDRYFD